ncbi:MAG: hypothetical protein AAFP13_06460 [Pseudomonadota bacterium]
MSGTLKALGATVVLWLIWAAALFYPGGLAVSQHEGDTIHLIDIVERMALGQVPHLDFMTPIGAGAFWPIAVLVGAGLSMGQAFVVSQVVLGGLIALAATWVASARMPWGWALALGALTVVTVMALMHGTDDLAVSVSMHYNRWAWGVSFVVLTMVVIPSEGRGPGIEGVLLGLGMAALLMVKVTYFAAILPIVIVLALLTGQRGVLLIGVASGLALVALLTLLLGVDFWLAYLGDLLAVARSEVRPQPGLPITQIVTGAGYVAGTVVAFAMLVTLRRTGFESEGLFVLMFFGAGAYITYQNFGNDPLWMAYLALLLGVWAGMQTEERPQWTLAMGAVALAAMIASSVINLGISPFRHALLDRDKYVPALMGTDRHQDLVLLIPRANVLKADIALGRGAAPFIGLPEPGEDAAAEDAPVVFRGRTLEDCNATGSAAYFANIARDLAAQGLAQGAAIFMMDILNPLWLYGDHPPLAGGAPWHYDDLPGIEAADFVLLPTCPVRSESVALLVEDMDGVPLTEVAERPLYILYARPSGGGEREIERQDTAQGEAQGEAVAGRP